MENHPMPNVRTFLSIAAAGALVVLAGCQMGSMERRDGGAGPVAARPSGVEGSWVDTGGTSISTFAGGSFQTVASDTGSRLSEGSYRYADNRTVSIEMRSLIRQTTNNVNCALATPTQLNCTSSAGNQFVLVRRTARS